MKVRQATRSAVGLDTSLGKRLCTKESRNGSAQSGARQLFDRPEAGIALLSPPKVEFPSKEERLCCIFGRAHFDMWPYEKRHGPNARITWL